MASSHDGTWPCDFCSDLSHLCANCKVQMPFINVYHNMCQVDNYSIFLKKTKTLQLTSGSTGNSSTSTSSSCTVDKIHTFHSSCSFLSVSFTIPYTGMSVCLPVTAKF